MNDTRVRGAKWLRLCLLGLTLIVLFVGFGQPPRPSLADATTVSLGRHCYDVRAFGADPLGASDSQPAFQAAFTAATLANGVDVCAPAGTYAINEPLTLYSAGSTTNGQGGPSLYGDGPGLTVLMVSASINALTSCPSFRNVLPPGFTVPSACPSLPTYPGTAHPNSTLTGIVLSNFSISRPSPAPGTLAPLATDFAFPSVNGLVVDNVCTNNSSNVFDLGQQVATTTSVASVTIRDGTCGYNFYGHFIALHGVATGLTVRNNFLFGNGTGVALDTTDLTDGTAYGSINSMSWVNNTIEQPFIGMLGLAGGVITSSGTTTIASSQWKGNVYDGCIIACYYFGVDPNLTTPPVINGLKVSDMSVRSQHDAFYIDGGLVPTGGVQGIQVGGPAFYRGSSGGTASSLIILRGKPANGDQIWIVWSTTNSSYHAITSTDTANSIAYALALAANPTPIAQQVNLANPSYGVIGVSMTVAPPNGSYYAQPYEVIVNSAHLQPIGLPTVAARCTPPGGGTAYKCWSGAYDVGDAVAIKNGASHIDVVGARVISQAGAAIHVWPGGGDQFNFLNDVLGRDQQVSSFTGIQFDNGSPNPTSFYIAGNEFVGATNPIVNAIPSPGFVSSGAAAAARANRGAFGATATGGSLAPVFSITNGGPFDCTYYLSWTVSGSISYTLTLPGLTSGISLGTQAPGEVVLPVGASFTATPMMGASVSATYSEFCQP